MKKHSKSDNNSLSVEFGEIELIQHKVNYIIQQVKQVELYCYQPNDQQFV